MVIFALSMHYDVATVSIISVSRLIVILVITPMLASAWSRRLSANGEKFFSPGLDAGGMNAPPGMTRVETAVLVVIALAGGLLMNSARVPAGFMLGAMCASGALSLYTGHRCSLSPKLTVAAQIGIGITIARQFGPQHSAYLMDPRFVFSILASGAYTILATLALGYFIQRMTGWDPLTCLLSTSAGGLSQMVLAAEEMNADSLTIGILHLARYLVIVLSMPFLITFLLR
jgi:membrane AbrB-like protein